MAQKISCLAAGAATPAEPQNPPGAKRMGIRHKKEFVMYKTLIVGLTVLMLAASAPLLSACHTTAGAGEDISATGHAITNSADKHTP